MIETRVTPVYKVDVPITYKPLDNLICPCEQNIHLFQPLGDGNLCLC